MKKQVTALSEQLNIAVWKKYGDQNEAQLKNHISYMNYSCEERDKHKKKYFRHKNLIRICAFLSGTAGSTMALWTFETQEVVLSLQIKLILTFITVIAPFVIVALENSETDTASRETWLRHSVYVNRCINECVNYVSDADVYKGKSDNKARKILLRRLAFHRVQDNEQFERNMGY